jgi:polyisoprenoid-binding protein YceI
MAFRHTSQHIVGSLFVLAVGLGLSAAVTAQDAAAPMTLASARVSLSGTSNVHAYTASTSAVRVTRLQVAKEAIGANFWDGVVKPGAIEAFEIAIAAATLTSPREGLDKNMHKALKVAEHPDITFRLLRLEPGAGAQGALRGAGVLRIAGVEREVALDLTTERKEGALVVRGTLPLLMTDYGIKPPVAMLGMLKTDPKVTVSFETVLAPPPAATSTIH